MDEKLYEYFLNGYKYDLKINDNFNFYFNKRYSINSFFKEFNKMIGFLDNFFYNDNKIVTSINSYDVIIPKKILKQIVKLYLYASNNNIEICKNIISDFLLTYYKTILNNKHKKSNYKIVEKEYKQIMDEFKLKSFYAIFNNELYDFYQNAIRYGIENDLYISSEVISKVLNNVIDNNKKNCIIELLLLKDNYCLLVSNYDSQIKKHKRIYLDFIKKTFRQTLFLNNINPLFLLLLRNECLNDNEIKEIVNLYVVYSNDICNKYKNKDEESIVAISKIEDLKNKLCDVLTFNLKDIYKDKIHECIINILSLKRFLLDDENYILSNMHEFKSTVNISNDKIVDFKKELNDNIFKIYSASTVDFDKCIEDALNYYSDFPIQSFVSNYLLDTKSQTYSTNESFSSNYNYSFENYYENIGRKYTLDQKEKLVNKLSTGYYVEMLRHLSRVFYIQQNITLSVLGENEFNDLIKKLKESIGCEKFNDYEMIVSNILSIEVNINKIMVKNSVDYSYNMIENLDKIFTIYDSNKIARNGIMYLYYTLYEHTGPNLRNRAMHGTLINEDLRIPLLISFSGLIISSWLLNE